MKAARARESYLTMADRLKEYLLCQRLPDEAGVVNLAEWRRANRDSLPGGFFWSYRVGDTASADTILMAARPD
jgi:hypothetical protein